MEENLSRHTWVVGETFSLADINAMNLVYFMPVNPLGAVSAEKTPRTMEWLYKMAERPATH
jgi:glutathione S-transferase